MQNILKQKKATATIQDIRFWDERAKKYEKLEWANKGDYLRTFLHTGRFKKRDSVLDVGTGTGIIAHSLAPHVTEVIGIDISDEMLKKAHNPSFSNIYWKRMDAHDLKFPEGRFDKVTARMVFHHLVEHAEWVMRECHRVLKKDGRMIFSEGIPPSEHVKPFFTEMFKLKERRLTFMEHDLTKLMKKARFRNIHVKTLFVRQTSIKNWLENSGLPREIQEKIFQMHVDLDDKGKRHYRMKFHDNDCFIDMKFAVLTGEK